MIIFLGVVFGALWGGYLAKRRKGNKLDIAQYAASSAIAFGLLGLFITIIIGYVLWLW